MKTLNASGVEIDVSYLSNSDCYLLVQALAPYHKKIVVTSDQENKHALRKGDIIKCYKQNSAKWAGKGWEVYELKTTPTRVLCQSTLSNPQQGPLSIRGLACDDYARPYLNLPASLSVEVNGMTFWAQDYEGLKYLRTALGLSNEVEAL